MKGQDLKLLLVKSGNICAFQGCGKRLTLDESASTDEVFLGELAHIIGESIEGPRGNHPMPLSDRDGYHNRILLCRDHHRMIDVRPQTYSIERLLGMKAEHEARIRASLEHFTGATELPPRSESVHSTLLPVTHMPRFIYSVECGLSSDREVRERLIPAARGEMAPFIRRGGRLYVFHSLADAPGPFAAFAENQHVQEEPASQWWDDVDKSNWFLDLAGSALNKLTGRKHLLLDKQHKRYYFAQKDPGKKFSIRYKSLNNRWASRQVVWQPTSRRTGLGRNYWYHYALSLRFFRANRTSWFLALRPEFKVTKDGVIPVPPSAVGTKVTRKQARVFNYDLLGEVHFWRDFLSDSRPQIVLDFGAQKMAIGTTLISGEVSWPGAPDEYKKEFKNISYNEDMFDLIERMQLGGSDWESEDLPDDGNDN